MTSSPPSRPASAVGGRARGIWSPDTIILPKSVEHLEQLKASARGAAMGRAKFAFDQVDVGEAARAAVVKRHELKASQSRLLFENSLLRSPGGGKQTPPRPKHMDLLDKLSATPKDAEVKKKKGAVSIPVVVEGPKKDDTHRVTHPEHEEMQALLKRYPFHRCVSCRAVMSPLRVEGITHCPLGRNGHILRLASLAELADVTVPDGFPLHTAKLSVEGKGGSRGGSSAAASHSLLVQSHTHLASSPFAMQRMEPTQTPALELLKDLPNREAAVHAARQTILDKLSIAVNALRDVLVAKEQLEGDVWRTDSLTRAKIFQSSQMPVRPSIPEIIDSLRECIDRQADDSWIRHRTRTEVELYHDVFLRPNDPAT